MVLVKRIWSKKSQISEHNELLDIWDTGSHIFERWPNGDEYYWRVISREEFNDGFIEILEKQPPWQVPAQVLRREQMPLQQVSASRFQLGGWIVEQEVEKTSSNEEVRTSQVRTSQTNSVHSHKGHSNGHPYKKNTSSQRPRIPPVQQKPRVQQKQLEQGPMVQTPTS